MEMLMANSQCIQVQLGAGASAAVHRRRRRLRLRRAGLQAVHEERLDCQAMQEVRWPRRLSVFRRVLFFGLEMGAVIQFRRRMAATRGVFVPSSSSPHMGNFWNSRDLLELGGRAWDGIGP